MSYIVQWVIVAVLIVAAAIYLIRHIGRDKCGACPYAGKCGKSCCDPKSLEQCVERMNRDLAEREGRNSPGS